MNFLKKLPPQKLRKRLSQVRMGVHTRIGVQSVREPLRGVSVKIGRFRGIYTPYNGEIH